jgi:hypothetical protein
MKMRTASVRVSKAIPGGTPGGELGRQEVGGERPVGALPLEEADEPRGVQLVERET